MGLIKTKHGLIRTPAFLPVATQAAIKGLTPDEMQEIGFEALLCNTYHLYLRPGHKNIQKLGGLHKFMHWPGPTVTDSGGFQVFSLGSGLGEGVSKIKKIEKPGQKRMVKIDQKGVDFKSHLDGSLHRLTPQKSIQIQEDLGADIIFAFDECTSPLDSKQYTEKAMKRTHQWAEICLKTKKRPDQFLFGIVQGGPFQDLRRESVQFIASLPFDGFGIGGALGQGDLKGKMGEVLDWTIPYLPENKPRHLLGIGYLDDIRKAVKKGVDLFDCVYPTRLARHGTFLTDRGEMNILNSSFQKDKRPIMANCSCYTCQNFSRAYLNHLFKAREMLGPRLATFHNLWLMARLMEKIRKNIKDDKI